MHPTPEPRTSDALSSMEAAAGFTAAQVIAATEHAGKVRKTLPDVSKLPSGLGLAAQALWGYRTGRVHAAVSATLLQPAEAAVLNAARAMSEGRDHKAAMARLEPAPEGSNLAGHKLEAVGAQGAIGLLADHSILSNPATVKTAQEGWEWPLAALVLPEGFALPWPTSGAPWRSMTRAMAACWPWPLSARRPSPWPTSLRPPSRP
jgi:hypothetical protein